MFDINHLCYTVPYNIALHNFPPNSNIAGNLPAIAARNKLRFLYDVPHPLPNIGGTLLLLL